MKMPAVRDRSDANPNLGEITGRSDLSQGYKPPPTAQVPGCDADEPCIAEKAQKPVVATPGVSGPMSVQPASAVVKSDAHADLTTNKLARGPAISNPNYGYMNSRS
jgi:hypothetical protein